ncbi:MAG TPA: DUF72 domain-containing protein [Legionellaceae bacterium]|nr:DUF72 domain-containing protein [Legionellaceae bacterium]
MPILNSKILEQKSKRTLRRKKQRLANIARAEKMHQLRTNTIIDKTVISNPSKLNKKQYHVGCSGWFYWHWRTVFYPPTLSTSQWFDHYAHHFKTVELNAPFYSWPTQATVKAWTRQAGRKQMIYTVKVCELITHIKRFKNTKRLIQDFGYIADILGKKMGCFLFQLPPSFHYTPIRLKNILNQLDHSRRNVVEFRHSTWWNETVYAAFRYTGTIFCSCSGPGLPDKLIKTADDIYIRFHGTKQWYRYNYSKEELEKWVQRILECEPQRVWAYFNNDQEGNAIKNAQVFLKLLKVKDRSQ